MALKAKYLGWLDRVPTSQTLCLGTISVCVGLTTGFGVWTFKRAIDVVQFIMNGGFGFIEPLVGKWSIVLIPILGGVIIGLISYYFTKEERHHGVAGIMESVALTGGRLRYKQVPV